MVAGRLCSSAVWTPLQPSVPQVCWFAEMAEPVQSVVLLLFSSNSHPKFVQGPLWQKSFCWYGFFSVCLLPKLCLCGAPGESGCPWQCLGISLIPDGNGLEPEAEGRAASCQTGSALWENHPLVLRNSPTMFHPSWFKLWWWLPAKLERRCRWQIRVQANTGGSREGWRLRPGGAALQVAQPQLGKGRAPDQELSAPWPLPSRIVWCC